MWNRWDIVEAYWCFYAEWHAGGLTRRCQNKGRGIAEQLHRLKFRARHDLSSKTLEDNGREIYNALVQRYHGKV